MDCYLRGRIVIHLGRNRIVFLECLCYSDVNQN